MRSKKDWTIPQFKEAYATLYEQCIEHSLEPQKFNNDWNRETCYGKVIQISELMIDAGVQPIVAFGPQPNQQMDKQPEKLGLLLADIVQNPELHIDQLAEQNNMSKHMVQAFKRRMKEYHPLVLEEAKKLDTSQLIEAFNKKIAMGLEYVDPVAFSGASLRDITVSLGIMIDKMRLLQGEPTQILSIDDRRSLHDVLPDLMVELKRRGMDIEGEYTVEG